MDNELCEACSHMVELLVGNRADGAQRRADSTPVVEGLDVGEDVRTCLRPRAVGEAMDSLSLESGEEALHRGVIMARADAVHARLDPPVLAEKHIRSTIAC